MRAGKLVFGTELVNSEGPDQPRLRPSLTATSLPAHPRGIAIVSPAPVETPVAFVPALLLAALSAASPGPTHSAPPAARLDTLGPVPTEIRVGEPGSPAFTFVLHDGNNNPIANRTVWLQVIGKSVSVYRDTLTTDDRGVVAFHELTVYGPVGDLSVIAIAGEVTAGPFKVRLVAGEARRLLVLSQPPRRAIADSLLRFTFRLRVLDAAGNPLDRTEVRVTPVLRETIGSSSGCTGEPALSGLTLKKSGDEGEVAFDSLGFSGCPGRYVLMASLTGYLTDTVASNPFEYDPDVSLDRNYMAISAIKSIAGEVPDDEFFDIRFRFRLSRQVFVMATSDVALTSRTSDSVRSSQRKLTEASLALNVRLHTRTDRQSGVPERSLFTGVAVKVFNTTPYAGVVFGAVESAGSPFQGSNLTVGYVVALYSTPFIVHGSTIRPQRHNLLADFLIRSESIDFFKSLNIRGSILLPFAHGEPLASRIGIAVPVGTLHLF